MDRLASCYFCGVAVEAPLEEYPVVPRDLRPSVEDQSTVVLCPDCRRKLSTIVEHVVAATTDPAQTDLSESVGTATAGGVDDTAAESGASPTEAVERFDTDRSNLGDFDTPKEREFQTLTSGTESVAEESDAEEEASPDAADSESDAGDDTDEDDETGEWSSKGRRRDAADGSSAGQQTETDADDSTGGAGGATAERDFSKSSYNKVVKLLQNREFPVEEEEITTVAGSAYGIGRPEAGRVIDALIDRGILERDGSQLLRADD